MDSDELIYYIYKYDHQIRQVATTLFMPKIKHPPIVINHSFDEFLSQCAMYHHIHSAIAVIDLGGKLVFQNVAFDKLWDALKKSKSEQSLWDNDQMQSCFNQVKAEVIKVKVKIKHVLESSISILVQPIVSANNELHGMMLTVDEETIQNVFQQKYNFALSRESHAELAHTIKSLSKDRIKKEKTIHTLLKGTPFGIMLIDSNRAIMQINSAAEDIFKQKSSNMIGLGCDQFFYCFQKGNQCPVCNRYKITLEETMAKSNHDFEVPLLRNTVLLDHEKEPVIIEAFVDLTERKVAEQESQIAKELAQQNEFEKQLAMTANKTKSVFLASMSHELRTPLNAIIGYSDYIEDIVADEDFDQDDLIFSNKNINRSGKNLLALINNILDLSKIEADKSELFIESFNIGELCEHTLLTVDVLAKKNNNEMKFFIEGNNHFFTDEMRFNQIILNLLSNACKFTKNGVVELSIKFYEKEGREWLQASVKDSGVGMSSTQLDKVFDEFAQAESNTSKEFGGTGLGLSICKKLAKLMKGDLEAASHFGKGSCFTLNIPSMSPEYQQLKS
ncbi:MAG: PAS domain-containing sensor histidine kinase [Methylococcales bacterium]|nr:PAS domain-containing sensor histidine kinase [Methylococcales bacterium]